MKADLLERLEEGNRELRSLVDAGLEFGATLEVDEVLRTAATRILAVSEADVRHLPPGRRPGRAPRRARRRTGTRTPKATLSATRLPSLPRRPRGGSRAQADVLADPETTEMERRDARSGGTLVLSVPLVSHARRDRLRRSLQPQVQEFAHERSSSGWPDRRTGDRQRVPVPPGGRTAQRMAMISESGMEFSASLDLRETLTATAKRLRAAVDTPDCEILLIRGESCTACSASGRRDLPRVEDRVAPWRTGPQKVGVVERRPDVLVSRRSKDQRAARQQYAACNETAAWCCR